MAGKTRWSYSRFSLIQGYDMNVHYSKDLSHAFVVSSDSLKKLVELLQNGVGKVDIRADCTDDLSRKFKTLKHLLAYENPEAKAIRRIYLSSHSDDYKKSASISFLDYPTRGISIDFTGREDVVSRLKDKTLDIIEGMVPSYDVMHRINFANAAYIVFVIVIVGFVWTFLFFLHIHVMSKWVPVSKINEDIINFQESIRYPVYVSLIITLLISIFLPKFLKSLFPRAVFTIGQGKSRFEHQQKVRWGVIIAFFVSLAAGFVVPIIRIFI